MTRTELYPASFDYSTPSFNSSWQAEAPEPTELIDEGIDWCGYYYDHPEACLIDKPHLSTEPLFTVEDELPF